MTKPGINSRRHDLHLKAPIDRWDEAIPLGNGLMGVLMWGGGRKINLSLDRGDIWDLRIPEPFKRPEFRWRTIIDGTARSELEQLDAVFNKPYSEFPYPTKLPTGRLELKLNGAGNAKVFHLDLRRAIGRVQFDNGEMDVFCAAEEPIGLVRVVGHRVSVAIKPALEVNVEKADQSIGNVASLGYPQPRRGRTGEVDWCEQPCAGGLAYAIAVGKRTAGRETLLAFAVTTNADASDAVAEACARIRRALDMGFDRMRKGHDRYWKAFWSKSGVRLGDAAIERHYYLVNYFYGAASRRGAPPIPLQGVWTADDGTLPPWKGDYHHDLNTQLTYWPYLAANHIDEGLCFFDFLWNNMPAFRENARTFYEAPGANVPGVMSLDGRQMTGWYQYSCHPTNSVWVAHNFYRHWRYTRDPEFLRHRAFPFCLENARCIEALLVEGDDGKLRLPLSSSPEIHDNRPSAWVKPNSNYDLSLMRWLFAAVIEMAGELDEREDVEHWTQVLLQMDELAVGPQSSLPEGASWHVDSTLYVAPGEPLIESHRHFSHLMAIHPLGTLNVDGSDRDRKTIYDSLRVLDHLGFAFWCGYSFSWMACMAARCARASRALAMLKLYLDVSTSRNGFHLNGDFRELGILAPTYRPFTLEGNFAAAEAVHEMLLQGWGGRIRLFPAVPEQWADVAFAGLRCEGAFLVSAWRKSGAFVRAEIMSERGMPLRLEHPHATRNIAIRMGGKREVFQPGRDICFDTRAGRRYVVALSS